LIQLYEQEATMRKGVPTIAGLALLAAVSTSAPAQAVPLSTPKALNVAADSLDATSQVNCWDGCGYGGYGYRPYYRSYYRPYYRSYGYGYGYRPYGYGYGYRPYYAGYGYRPFYRPYGYGYGYRPRPRFYVGSSIYGY
jgi:hypothetical protein